MTSWTGLGTELFSLYDKVVRRETTDRAILLPAFDALDRLARAADPELREHAVISARREVPRLLQVMRDAPAVFRPYVDRVMRVVLDLPTGEVSWTRWIQRYVANTFLHFIQGITMFAAGGDAQGVTIGRPAYHRTTSCGPWNPSADPRAIQDFEKSHLTCNALLPAAELQRRRRNVWTCLVERLVYNELHEEFIGLQDTGHRFNEQRVVQRLFETCFALHYISIAMVKLTYDAHHHVPVSMFLLYETPHHRITEEYTRTPTGGRRYGLDVNVHVRREVRPNANASDAASDASDASGAGDEYERVQSYLQPPAAWLPLSPGAPPRGGGSEGAGAGAPPRGRRRRRFVPNCPRPADPWSVCDRYNTSRARPPVGTKKGRDRAARDSAAPHGSAPADAWSPPPRTMATLASRSPRRAASSPSPRRPTARSPSGTARSSSCPT